jgi:regulator of replication initiation timing
LKDAKLPSDNDKKIFWSIASHCPADIKDLEGQISWTIERVNEVKAEVAKEMVEETNRKKKEKGDLKVLGRKGSKTTSSEEEEENKPPMTLVEQLKASRRRV